MAWRRILLVALLSASPALASAAAPPTTFAGLANLAVQILSIATAVLVSAAFVVYLWGMAMGIYKSGSGNAKSSGQLRTLALGGIIVFFVIFMIWGILRVIANTLFGNSSYLQIGL